MNVNVIEKYREKIRQETELRIESKTRLNEEQLASIISNCILEGNMVSLEETREALYRKRQSGSIADLGCQYPFLVKTAVGWS